jgi:hypothetical protein
MTRFHYIFGCKYCFVHNTNVLNRTRLDIYSLIRIMYASFECLPVNERSLGVHQVELVVKPGKVMEYEVSL